MVNVKILGISTSARHANTEIAVKWALESAAELPGVETEFISLAGKTIYPCDSCFKCLYADLDDPCPGIPDDDFREVCLKMIQPDGLIMGAMVDYQAAGARFHNLKSRLMCLEMLQAQKEVLRNKAFGAIAIGGATYGGMETALQYMVMWAIQCDMHVVGCGPEKDELCGSGYLGASGATDIGKVSGELFRHRGALMPNTPAERKAIHEDQCCYRQCRALGKRVADMAKITRAGYGAVPAGELYWPKGPIKTGGYDFGQKS